jgi:hypothetical protein
MKATHGPAFRIPFQGLSRHGWVNLAIAGLLVFYSAQVALDISWNNFCGHLGIDYCAFWSAGEVANTDGYAAVYDLRKLEAVQQRAFPRDVRAQGTTATIPTPYLPVFLLPFGLLSPLGPEWGYVLWTAANFAVLAWYIRFFVSRYTGSPVEKRVWILLLASFPVFLNFFYGQVNTWLTIFVGEYMRAAAAGKPYRAGMWLSGLLIKPQYLVLIGIALVMRRAGRTLVGLALMSALLLGASYAMIGGPGFSALLQLWLGFAGGLPATGPNVMMNWRAVGLFLDGLTKPTVLWPLIVIAMLLTALAGLAPWRRAIAPASPYFATALLGTLAATSAFVWHSHTYSAMILLCPLLLLRQSPRRLPEKAVELWVLVPPAFQLAATVLSGLNRAGVLTGFSPDSVYFVSAVAPFGFNLYFVIWALQHSRQVDSLNPVLPAP